MAHMPTSACGPSGVSLDDARAFVRRLARRWPTPPVTTPSGGESGSSGSCGGASSSSSGPACYLHLAEGAPSLGSGPAGARAVGKALAYLASDFAECRNAARQT